MKIKLLKALPCAAVLFLSFALSRCADAQTITHQITLPAGDSWCEDSMIDGLFNAINTYRTQNGVPALAMNSLGMEDAEMRAVQVAAYLQTVPPTSPTWDPHQGYDTTAASLGYDIVSENLAWVATDPNYIVGTVWDDPLHDAAMLSRSANVTGVSCVYSDGWPYWTYEPGIAANSPAPAPAPTPTPAPSPAPAPPTPLDAQESEFLALLNNYRVLNGAGPLQVSETLQAAAEWMSTDMATKNYLSHTDSLGRGTATRLAAFGYTHSPWGEDILAGDTDAQDAFNDFLTACDPDALGNCTYEHRMIMLSGSFVATGIARAYNANSDYGWYWTTDFGGYLDQGFPSSPSSTPVISSFVASPPTIADGQQATLSWSVTGATSISLDNGIGAISNGTSVTVAPTKTTTYNLTAGSSAGTVSAAVTVTVTQTGEPAQPPTAPILVSAIAKSSTEVDLSWTASTDPTGIAGYQIIRNGTSLTEVPASQLTYADTAVKAGTAYSYAIKAFDSAGLYSAASNVLSTTPPAAPAPAPSPSPAACPAPVTAAFTGCYYNDVLWLGTPALVRTDSQINFNWTQAPPSPAVLPRSFSARWEGNFNFAAGYYVFTLSMSGGATLYIDGGLIGVVSQVSGGQTDYEGVALTAGQHLIRLDYYNTIGSPTAAVSWQPGVN